MVKSKPTTAPHSLGLEYRDGFLYEGTGLAGQVLQKFDVPQPFFGEGITVVNQQILRLTWQSQTGFVYDKSSFKVLRRNVVVNAVNLAGANSWRLVSVGDFNGDW